VPSRSGAADAPLTQPSHIAAYHLEDVVVYEPRLASAARTASTDASSSSRPG